MGEAQDLIPGSSAELESELDPWWGTDFEGGEENSLEWRPPVMIKVTEVGIHYKCLTRRYILDTDYTGRYIGSGPSKSLWSF